MKITLYNLLYLLFLQSNIAKRWIY